MGLSNQLKMVSRHSVQLGQIFCVFAVGALFITVFSWALQFIPLIGISEKRFYDNGIALTDQSVTRILLGYWFIVALLALWINKVWALLSKVGALLEEAVVALMGGMAGVALAVGAFKTSVDAILNGALIIAMAAFIRFVVADEREDKLFRILISPLLFFGFYYAIAVLE